MLIQSAAFFNVLITGQRLSLLQERTVNVDLEEPDNL